MEKIAIINNQEYWICENCTYPNNMWRDKCYMCESEKESIVLDYGIDFGFKPIPIKLYSKEE